MRRFAFAPVPLLASCAALVGLSGSAWALDCGKAKAPIDKAICATPSLKTQDAALSALYFASLRKQAGPRRDLLLDTQRGWLKTRAETCGAEKNGALVACVAKAMTQRSAQLTACFAGATPDPTAKGTTCPVLSHRPCPEYSVSADAGVWAYPVLVARLNAIEAEKRKNADDKDQCLPEDAEHFGSPDSVSDDTVVTLAGSGNGWVSVRETSDGFGRGAAHPFHGESVTAYDTASGKPIAVDALMPGVKAKAASRKLWDAANQHLSVPCCDEEGTKQKLDDLQIAALEPGDAGRPLPDGWSIDPDGSLRVFYQYSALGRDFVAEAPIPRAIFLGWVADKYRPFFAKTK